MKRLLFYGLAFLLLLSLVTAAPHSLYPAFGEPQSGFSVSSSGAVSASDDAVYKTGYFSTGGAWQTFSLTGSAFSGASDWLTGSVSASLSNLPTGTVYAVVYSCSRVDGAWDCHGGQWQLQITTTNGGPVVVGDALCGDGTCDSNIGETCSLCRIDCGICPGPIYESTRCGDGVCDPTEYCSVCSADCGTCSQITCPCPNGEYCSTDLSSSAPPVCLKVAADETFFVSTAGSDSNSGTFAAPFATWQKAFDVVGPGDIVYIRGGDYLIPANNRGGVDFETSGTTSNRILISNYPGERPSLDFRNVLEGGPYNGKTFNGLTVLRADHVDFYGLALKNLWQQDGEDEMTLFKVSSSSDVIVENCLAHDTGGHGFESTGSKEVYFINCDTYHNVDYITSVPASNPVPGNDGTGFSAYNWVGDDDTTYFLNCRSWNNGDQGFSSGSPGYIETNNCWSFDNGVLEGGGHGFKMGGNSYDNLDLLNRLYKNNIAANNRAQGFGTNDADSGSAKMNVFSNFAYYNGQHPESNGGDYGFRMFGTESSAQRELLRVYRNNIAYDNKAGEFRMFRDGVYTHDHNSWDTSGITLSDADFESLDYAQLYLPRKPDGSLPDITFGKVRSDSDLITQGVYIG